MRRILFLLFFVSQISYAQEYYWGAGELPNQQFPTPTALSEALRDFASSVYGMPGRSNFRVTSVTLTSTTKVTIQISYDYLSGSTQGTSTLGYSGYRYGTTCPPDTTYNSQTGACESDDPCGDKLGDEFNFSISGVGSTDYMFITSDGSFSAPSQRGCFDGCSASTVDQSCQTSSLGPWRCGGTAVFDGGNCGEGTESPETPAVTESAELEKPASELTTENQPCNYITQPDGSQTCTSRSVEDHKGQICGTFNGEVICPEIQPEFDSTQIDTTVTTEDNGDGTTTVTKTDVATVTNCTGTSCNTSTTTNTTINNGGSISGTCTGALCPTAGNPDGNGDGCGDGDGGVIGQPGLGEFGEEVGEFSDSVDAFMNRVSDAPVMSALDSIGGSAPAGNCSIGATSVWFFEFDAGPIFCDMAPGVLSPLYPLFLAIWAFAAVRILFSA